MQPTYVTSVAYVQGSFPLNTSSPALAVRVSEEAVLQCQSLLKQLQPFISCQHLFFSWGLAGQRAFVSLTPEPQQSSLSLFFARHSGRTILPGCHVENIFHILSFSDWPKSMNNLLFICSKASCFQVPTLNHSSSILHDREGIQSDCNLQYTSSRKPTAPKKAMLPSCWLVLFC